MAAPFTHISVDDTRNFSSRNTSKITPLNLPVVPNVSCACKQHRVESGLTGAERKKNILLTQLGIVIF